MSTFDAPLKPTPLVHFPNKYAKKWIPVPAFAPPRPGKRKALRLHQHRRRCYSSSQRFFRGQSKELGRRLGQTGAEICAAGRGGGLVAARPDGARLRRGRDTLSPPRRLGRARHARRTPRRRRGRAECPSVGGRGAVPSVQAPAQLRLRPTEHDHRGRAAHGRRAALRRPSQSLRARRALPLAPGTRATLRLIPSPIQNTDGVRPCAPCYAWR